MVLVLTASALIAGTFALLTIQKDLPASGSIKGVGVGIYSDLTCNNPKSSIDFGVLEPGSQKDFPFYLRNEGNTDLSLSMTSNNWDPVEAEDYLSLTWDREGQQTYPGQVVRCVLTLSVSEDIHDISNYIVTITITATG
jgi:hypothetical protein